MNFESESMKSEICQKIKKASSITKRISIIWHLIVFVQLWIVWTIRFSMSTI